MNHDTDQQNLAERKKEAIERLRSTAQQGKRALKALDEEMRLIIAKAKVK